MATERSRTTPVARVLQVCLHLLVAGLLALAVARAAFVDRGGDPAAVAAAASATAAVYAAGPRLAAVHVKDARFPPEGPRVPTALGEGQMDYTLIRAWLHADHPDAALLRDEVILPAAARDLAYMKAM